MKNRRMSKIVAILIALIMIFSDSIPVLAEIVDPSSITISSVDEFMSFVSKCSLDTWSENKTVILKNDLDLGGMDFNSIPIFSGTFDGAGHSIIGINISSAGSEQGFFRYLESGGTIKDISIVGTIAPGGSKCDVGGIVGNNSGSVQDCVFAGIVSGDTTVGGIVGLNNESGVVTGCATRGTISGEKNTGGICGKNLGSVLKCSSSCNVNTTSTDTKVSMDDIDLDIYSTIDNLTTISANEEEDKTLTSHTDTGGVVGYSSGIIQGCTNTGTVGYQHMGYNVGGIVGRQSGYLVGCSNSGTVYGRKDVGGIVGQTEPYIIMNMSDDVLSQLQTELNKLQSLINDSLDEASASSDSISAQLTDISGYTDTARDDAKTLSDKTQDFVDNNINEINDIGAEISNSIDKMTDVLDNVEAASDTSTKALKEIKKALNSMEDASDEGEDAIKSAEDAVDDLIVASSNAQDAIVDFKNGLKTLGDAVSTDGMSTDYVNKAIADLSGSMKDLSTAIQGSQTALDNLNNALSNMSDLNDLLDPESRNNLFSALSELNSSLAAMNGALIASTDALAYLLENITIDEEKVQEALKLFDESFAHLNDAMANAAKSLKKINDTLEYAVDASDDLSSALSKMSDATGTITKASSYLTDAVSEFGDLVEELSNEEPIEFSELGDDFRTTGDSLYSSLNNISEGLDGLNNTISSSTKNFINNVKAINNQFNTVMNLVITSITDLQISGDDTDLSNYILDTSDEYIKQTRLGKVADCQNSGEVLADRNVGGIVGTMDIEYDLDPETDLSSTNLFRTTFETRSVLEGCVNDGKITGKKDCIGGVVGRMSLGTVLECENYGNTESTDGDYVGGIAGITEATLRDSYSKCTLEGKDYIGGIAGSGIKIDSCYSIVNIEDGVECIGAIAGEGDVGNGKITDNYFVSDKIAGIDGISYSGCAEPISFDDLSSKDGLPSKFVSFTITFVADDVTVETIPVKYGDRLYSIELPEVPPKDGYYGKWPDFATEEVTGSIVADAEYIPWEKVIASTELESEGKKSLGLAEGQFSDEAVLHVTDSSDEPPKEAKASEHVTVWDVSLLGTNITDSDIVPVRLLNEGGGKAHVWHKIDGEWEEVKADVNGHYLKIDMTGTKETFCIASNSLQFDKKSIIGACFIGAAFIVYIITYIKNKIKNKKEGKLNKKQKI